MTPTLLLLFQWLLALHVSAAVGFIFLRLGHRLIRGLTFEHQRQLHYGLLSAAILVPSLIALYSALTTPTRMFRAPIQVWAPIKKTNAKIEPLHVSVGSTTYDQSGAVSSVALTFISLLTVSLSACGLLLRLVVYFRDARKLKRILRRCHRVRAIGGLSILSDPKGHVPFVTAIGNHATVVLPQSIVFDYKKSSLVLSHEFAHLRNGDLRWNLLNEIVKGLLFFNPLMRRWLITIDEINELNCDERVLSLGRWEPQTYGALLTEVALQLRSDATAIAGTAMMSVSRKFFIRRIEMLFREKPMRTKKGALVFAFVSTLAISIVAFAAQNTIEDRRLTLEQAQKLAEKVTSSDRIPIVVNQEVLVYLNKAAGNQRGRRYIKASLKRMEKYNTMIRSKLASAKLPLDLMAVPIVESGYQNYDNGTGAGIWSFIPDTARSFGLIVNDEVDERFDEEKLTDAALNYYQKLYREFKSWDLSLLAYNSGEKNVREAIAKAGTRNAFELIRGKYLKEEAARYLPMTYAALIIFNNPELVEK